MSIPLNHAYHDHRKITEIIFLLLFLRWEFPLPTLVDRMRTVVKEAPAEEECAEEETVSTKVASTQTPEAGGSKNKK